MHIQADGLTDYICQIFTAAGCSPAESRRIAENLVDANLTGHDSHGVIRTPRYLKWLTEEKLLPDRDISVVSESDGLIILDGNGNGNVTEYNYTIRGTFLCRLLQVYSPGSVLANTAKIGSLRNHKDDAEAKVD